MRNSIVESREKENLLNHAQPRVSKEDTETLEDKW